MPPRAIPDRAGVTLRCGRVPFQRPELAPIEDIERYFALSRAARQFSNGGPCHDLLIERAGPLLGGRLVVPVANGSIGLAVALRALVGEPPGDRREILVASFTFAAAAAAIVWCGLVPVFCDVEPAGWHLAPAALDEAIASRGGRVAGILAGATFGTPPAEEQIRGWARIAGEAGVPLIVDSAAAFGVRGVESADAEVFSLHATKPLPVGEGGLVAVRDPRTERRLRILINHGLDETRVAAMAGLNGKLDEWHAAAALAGIDRLAGVIATRQDLAASLRAFLCPLGIAFQRDAAESATQFVPALMPSPKARDEVLLDATAAGVELRTYFSPLHLSPAFAACPRHGELTVTEDLAGRILSLPMANDLLPEEIERIAACVGSRLR